MATFSTFLSFDARCAAEASASSISNASRYGDQGAIAGRSPRFALAWTTLRRMATEAQYSQIIAHVFARHYKRGAKEVLFDREEIVDAAQKLGLPRPKNVGDVVYSFRFRKAFPEIHQKDCTKRSGVGITKSWRKPLLFCARKGMVGSA
jgi:hypothetical protein